jgi:glycine/D-amino acid oxidase-like deaminating enzyme
MTDPITYPRYQAASGWNALLPARQARTAAPEERHFEAVVIGAGVTGLAAARRIAELQPQARVLLIDASTIGEGSSGRNSGFLINLPHNTGMSGHGSPVEVARKQIKLYNTGIDWLKSLVDQHGIDCGWNPVGKYHAAATPDGEKRLRETLRQYEQWGVAYRELGADQLQAALGTRYYHYGYHSHNNIFVQPAALVRGLADHLPANVQLWEGEPVLALSRGRRPFEVRTRSATLMADRVVIANNGFATRLGLARDRVFTIYTYAALTPKLPVDDLSQLGDAPEWGVIPANRWARPCAARPRVDSWYAALTLRVGAGYGVGARHAAGLLRRRYSSMRSFAFEQVWGGVTALTRNGALYFGRVEEGLYVSVGCNGAGLLKGSMFGKLLGEMACGAQSPELADALGFQRPTWLPPEPIRRIAVVSAIHYQKYRAGLER